MITNDKLNNFLTSLHDRGVTLRVENEKLHVVPRKTLTPDEVNLIKDHKPQIIAILTSTTTFQPVEPKAEPPSPPDDADDRQDHDDYSLAEAATGAAPDTRSECAADAARAAGSGIPKDNEPLPAPCPSPESELIANAAVRLSDIAR